MDFYINESFLNYFVDHVTDNLTEKELQTLKEFERKYAFVDFVDMQTEFETCEVCNLKAMCYLCSFIKK